MTTTTPFPASLVPRLPAGLGTNTFARTTDEAISVRLLDAFVDAGGTLLDTADTYSDGASEVIIGRWLRARGNRDRVIISTKGGNHADSLGLSRAAVTRACDASLGRLGTDHVDLYLAHYQDDATPLEESVEAFDRLVRAGKVRAYGLSNFDAGAVAAWIEAARAAGLTPPVALQPHYSLVHREPFESALAPIARDAGLAVFPYRSLGGGFLSGKYRTLADTEGRARGAGTRHLLNPTGLRLVDVVEEIAGELGVTAATVALAWLGHQPTVTAPLASATTEAQLAAIVAAPATRLAPPHLERLDVASRPIGRLSPAPTGPDSVGA